MPIGIDTGEVVFDSTRQTLDERGLSPDELADAVRAQDERVGQVWTRWQTAEDERVCPECGPLDGHAWCTGDGPEPPLHNHCRCTRQFAFIEWSTGR